MVQSFNYLFAHSSVTGNGSQPFNKRDFSSGKVFILSSECSDGNWHRVFMFSWQKALSRASSTALLKESRPDHTRNLRSPDKGLAAGRCGKDVGDFHRACLSHQTPCGSAGEAVGSVGGEGGWASAAQRLRPRRHFVRGTNNSSRRHLAPYLAVC